MRHGHPWKEVTVLERRKPLSRLLKCSILQQRFVKGAIQTHSVNLRSHLQHCQKLCSSILPEILPLEVDISGLEDSTFNF